jgi:hypothetical protein
VLIVVSDITGVSESEVNILRLLDEEDELLVSARRRDKRDAQGTSTVARLWLWKISCVDHHACHEAAMRNDVNSRLSTGTDSKVAVEVERVSPTTFFDA